MNYLFYFKEWWIILKERGHNCKSTGFSLRFQIFTPLFNRVKRIDMTAKIFCILRFDLFALISPHQQKINNSLD